MNTAEALIKLLEEDGVKHIFGHPGEQILPFYKALKDSSIGHILTRHEQGAAHAAEAYARSSGNYGLCVSTAGPGAMNLVMGVATAFKDSVPILVIRSHLVLCPASSSPCRASPSGGDTASVGSQGAGSPRGPSQFLYDDCP